MNPSLIVVDFSAYYSTIQNKIKQVIINNNIHSIMIPLSELNIFYDICMVRALAKMFNCHIYQDQYTRYHDAATESIFEEVHATLLADIFQLVMLDSRIFIKEHSMVKVMTSGTAMIISVERGNNGF